MNILLYLTSSSYRKCRWAGKHLAFYRANPFLLPIHQIARTTLVLSQLVETKCYFDYNEDKVYIPKFKQISAKDLTEEA